MPLAGYVCHAPGREGKTCRQSECKQRCINGNGCAPGPFMGIYQHTSSLYENFGSISGSQLVKPCDGQTILHRLLDYYQDPKANFAAAYRGSLVHRAIEQSCLDDPDFASWDFERRYFAYLDQDDEITPLPFLQDWLVPGEEDWDAVNTALHYIEAKGNIILSGQCDAYDPNTGTLHDHKTQTKVWNEAKDEWVAQLNFYRLLMNLHGDHVRRIIVNAMDASQQVTIDIPLVLMESWVPDFLIPRIRELHALQQIDHIDDAWDHCQVNFLCSMQNRNGKSWCPFNEGKGCVVWDDWDAAGRPKV